MLGIESNQLYGGLDVCYIYVFEGVELIEWIIIIKDLLGWFILNGLVSLLMIVCEL